MQPPPALSRQPLEASHPSPFAEVTSGSVHAVILKKWSAAPLATAPLQEGAALHIGVVASPNLDGWERQDGSVPGLEAMWVDVAHARVPSDYYYLAATGAAVPDLAASNQCVPSHLQVIVDHRPAFAGDLESPGDYAVQATGTCERENRSTRWAYFVAAPGFGPVHQVGLPTSGLYVVFAVLPDGPDAPKQLRRMLLSARFGGTTVSDLIAAARRSAQLR